jgi:hypothetical protein
MPNFEPTKSLVFDPADDQSAIDEDAAAPSRLHDSKRGN